jgi:hypothetical protein
MLATVTIFRSDFLATDDAHLARHSAIYYRRLANQVTGEDRQLLRAEMRYHAKAAVAAARRHRSSRL